MWTCSKCDRIFEKEGQPHSCQKVSLNKHFENKEEAKILFNSLFKQIENKVGKCKIVSLPCCIHLFGTYDFLAALPKKDRLEIRMSLDEILKSKRLEQSVPLSQKYFKNCIDIKNKDEIDNELLNWISKSYHLKDKIESKVTA